MMVYCCVLQQDGRWRFHLILISGVQFKVHHVGLPAVVVMSEVVAAVEDVAVVAAVVAVAAVAAVVGVEVVGGVEARTTPGIILVLS
jgi:hypothetical protein